MKKIFIPILTLTILLTPFLVSAEYAGLVKCDGVVLPGETGKTRCDFVALMNQIQFLINWGIGILMVISVAVAAYTGILYMYAGFTGNVNQALEAKSNFMKIFGGILIVLSAWLIVRTLLNWLLNKDVYKFDLLG
jgi:hypothetical protein